MAAVFHPFEVEYRAQGISLVAGVDEAGRGCLAGPVVAASCILPPDVDIPDLNDSKKLTPHIRERLFDVICHQAVAFGIARIEADEIDRINIRQASLKAMCISLTFLQVKPEMVLIDGRDTIQTSLAQKAIINGDALCRSIAAASILAKVTRDRIMRDYSKSYPSFTFATHKGYPTKAHCQEIFAHGPTEIHRRTFGMLKNRAIFLNPNRY
ncbi:MAG: ribonuclease HII [Deltaproteobacteria bacterium]|nr:ribonuclease HII [Deltaproteobacteria bacterium]